MYTVRANTAQKARRNTGTFIRPYPSNPTMYNTLPVPKL